MGTIMAETYTRDELVSLYPDGTVTAQFDDEVRVLTTDEWSAWIDRLVGTPNYLGQVAQQKRQLRDDLLASSDYRMVTDAPWDVTAWATYRQALRDLPTDPAWPDVQFPVPPDAQE